MTANMTPQKVLPKKIWEGPALLGESPLWDYRTKFLYWVDIENCKLYRQKEDGSDYSSIDLPAPAGSIALWHDGGLIAALGQGLFHIEPEQSLVTAIASELSGNDCLMNDGKADRSGNFIFGEKHLKESDPVAGCWRYQSGLITPLEQKFIVFNGPAFSPAGDRIYFTDSPTQQIMTASYSPTEGITSQPEVFVQLSGKDGYPDGMTVDSEGCLWNAQWDGWAITRYRPDGTIDQKIDMPVQRPTSLCFGGEDLKTLFVTSASTRLSPQELVRNPDAGALYKLDLQVAGLPEKIITN
ncbi:SMP-30/gluconolactonase/LRE family protein [Kiloniella litopenaei]|uniref:SMP-30/gluconolactonase/LRE family protein n=1 Tax=Kiloniella litopenaei TaxID=1549748 RepID=UPI003BA85C5E